MQKKKFPLKIQIQTTKERWEQFSTGYQRTIVIYMENSLFEFSKFLTNRRNLGCFTKFISKRKIHFLKQKHIHMLTHKRTIDCKFSIGIWNSIYLSAIYIYVHTFLDYNYLKLHRLTNKFEPIVVRRLANDLEGGK
jgi:hypothetical protein